MHSTGLVLLSLFLAFPVFAPEPRQAVLTPGLAWVRFDSSRFERPRDSGVADRIDVDTGTVFRDYSQIWVGLIRVMTDEVITFTAEADNGLRLVLDDQTVIEGWGTDAPRQGRFRGRPNSEVPLRLEYVQDGGVGYLRLHWQWRGHDREPIPASALFHTADQGEYVRALLEGREKPMVHEDRSVIYTPEQQPPQRNMASRVPVPAEPGPHLLLDDVLIAECSGVERVVLQPQRDPGIPNPIVTGPGDGCFQPFFTVLRDPSNDRWRIWYGARRPDRNPSRSHLATMTSDDGIRFSRPHRICQTPEIQFGSEVIDRGEDHRDPSTRYVYSYWLDGGMRLLASADGLVWQPLVEGVVLPHDHDITGIDWDPLRRMYAATVSTFTTGADWSGSRRVTMMSFSHDLVHWQKPWFILVPSDRLDEGETQFYAMDAYLTRGPLRIGMVKVLRDDLRAADTEPGSFGRAHTSLAWSRDGRTWVRDRSRFFEPDDDPRAWDHAHAWIDEQVVVGDKVYLYYGGYRQGHKVNRFEERQLGLVTMPLDRYVSRRGGHAPPGRLRTVPIRLGDSPVALQVNADATGGEIRVQLRDATTGRILPGMRSADCRPVTADGLRQPVHWLDSSLTDLKGRVIQVEFELVDADLFAFEFVPEADR